MSYIVVKEFGSTSEPIQQASDHAYESMTDAREAVKNLPDGSYEILKVMCEPITVSRETKVVISGGESTSPRKRKG